MMRARKDSITASHSTACRAIKTRDFRQPYAIAAAPALGQYAVPRDFLRRLDVAAVKENHHVATRQTRPGDSASISSQPFFSVCVAHCTCGNSFTFGGGDHSVERSQA